MEPMMNRLWSFRGVLGVVLASLGCAAAAAAPARRPDPFSENVRTTEPLSPADELRSFHLPPGFEAQLVASEPQIAKPINFAFDARGRMWVTVTQEYPFPSKKRLNERGETQGRDRILILDIDPATGQASKVTTFAEGLNIPMGIYPYKDGCVAYSVPFIYAFHDTTHPDRPEHADRREVLYGPYDYSRDTHGMTNSFTRGYDGWLYANHGFNNRTTLAGRDGQAIFMDSGHCYRMALDGAHVDLISHGMPNPFGMVFDELGNQFVADCSSFPIHQIIRGGYYPHFGRATDGLGDAPRMMSHLHGSTAIGGIVYYDDDKWPSEFFHNTLVGNPVTCRIDRDALTYAGSSPTAHEKPDFMATDDPWYRPVYLQLGPDGAVYIADFYNRIIGHYEVPLDHPGRDRQRGRLWRVVYKGTADHPAAPLSFPDLTALNAEQLVQRLADPNMAARFLAADQLTDRVAREQAVAALKAAYDRPAEGNQAEVAQKVHCLWLLHRLGALDDASLAAAARNGHPTLRVHAAKVLMEKPALSLDQANLLLADLKDEAPFVQRAAVEALGRHASTTPAALRPLLEFRRALPAADTHLIYATRRALREQLLRPGAYALLAESPDAIDLRTLADISVAVPTEEAGAFLAAHLDAIAADPRQLEACLKHAIRYAPTGQIDALVTFARQRYADNADGALALFKSIQDATVQRGGKLGPEAVAWGTELAGKILRSSGRTKKDAQRLAAALDAAKGLKAGALAAVVGEIARDRKADPAIRSAAVKAVGAMDPAAALAALKAVLAGPSEPAALREAAAQGLADLNDPAGAARAALVDALRAAPQGVAVKIALALASSTEGAEALLNTIAAGKASASLLQQRAVADRLSASKLPDVPARVAALTKGLPPADAELQKLLDARVAAYKANTDPAHADPAKGQKLFATNCMICHSLEGQGKMVGPPLDGVGLRGIDRLAEDVLDPNRNVDPAFYQVIVKLADKTVLNGLQRREEGESVVFADSTGQEIVVPKKNIVSRRETHLSLMPTNFGEVLAQEDFNHLMAFLLSKGKEGQSTNPSPSQAP